MNIFERIADLRDELNQHRLQGKTIGFVPTMGNLHEGHIQLVKQAKELCDVVVVSIFVNPLQFGLNEDWELYPRTFESDCAQLVEAECDILLYPNESEVYPNGMEHQTRVVVPTMTDVLCGASRPGHFEGVTTIVTKLFNMVQPDKAIFGIKDFQQLAIIRRMTEDLCMPIDIVAAPIARAEDGLALSSRNGYLTESERPVAANVNRSLKKAIALLEEGERDYSKIEECCKMFLVKQGLTIDYFSIRHASSLEEACQKDTDLVVLVAVYLGNTRLIDNESITLK